MLKYLLNVLKITGLLLILIGALSILGQYINSLFDWNKLTTFFSILYNGIYNFNWFWDIPLLWFLLGKAIGIFVAYWTFKATLWVIHWFKEIN